MCAKYRIVQFPTTNSFTFILYCTVTNSFILHCTVTNNKFLYIFSFLSDTVKLDLASHVLQYVFTSFTGLRYPVAYYGSETATASTYLIQFYNVVDFLLEGGFKIIFANFDGAGPNRKFLVSHFQDKDPVDEAFTTVNRLTGELLVLSVDPSVSEIFF